MLKVQCRYVQPFNAGVRASSCNILSRVTGHWACFVSGTIGAAPAPMEPPYDIQDRSFLFGCRIISFCRELSIRDAVTRRLSWQLLNAGTSVGANLEEADAGQTKPDFIAKVSIARKECGEARHWLRLIAFAEPSASPDRGTLARRIRTTGKDPDHDYQERSVEPRARRAALTRVAGRSAFNICIGHWTFDIVHSARSAVSGSTRSALRDGM